MNPQDVFNQPDAKPGETNGSPIDSFTFVHFTSGCFARKAGLTFGQAVVLACLWELAEDSIKDRYGKLFPNPTHESKANSLCDIAALVAGYASGM